MGLYSTGWDSQGDGRNGEAAPQDPNGLIGADPQSAGRVRGTRPSYGGYTSTVKVGPDGKLYNDASASGQQDAINRYRSLGAAAAARQAYQVDYSNADRERAQAYQDRGNEMGAADLLRKAAMGNGPTATTGIGRGMVDSQLQGQLGASAGARGMAATAAATNAGLRQGAAMGAQNAGSIAGMRGGELASARAGYAGGANAIRGQDYASMGMANHQAITQGQIEQQQRQANANQQLGYEGLAYGVNQASTNAAMATDQADEGAYNNALAIDNSEKNRALKQQGATMGAIGAGISSFNYGGGGRDDGYDGGIYRNSPY